MRRKQLKPFQAVVVGQESLHNLRLADLLRKLIGPDRVFRYLELRHLLEFLADNMDHPVGIFLDLFSFEIPDLVERIGYIRQQYPKAVFCLYMTGFEYEVRWQELPDNWQKRLRHYFKLYKEPQDTELEPVVRNLMRYVVPEAEVNMTGPPVSFDNKTGESLPVPEPTLDKHGRTLFISYSRQDWDSFVAPLANRLRDKGYSVWIDQHLLVGGEDWMDSIGQALDQCKLLLLVMSPDSLGSKFVKMEYRYFFNHDKIIVPLLWRKVERIPPELSITQYIDFTESPPEAVYPQLFEVIEANIKRP